MRSGIVRLLPRGSGKNLVISTLACAGIGPIVGRVQASGWREPRHPNAAFIWPGRQTAINSAVTAARKRMRLPLPTARALPTPAELAASHAVWRYAVCNFFGIQHRSDRAQRSDYARNGCKLRRHHGRLPAKSPMHGWWPLRPPANATDRPAVLLGN